MNAVSKLIGIIALIFMIIGLIPLLGWINWLVLILAATGLLFGALSDKTDGRNLNAIVLVIALIRLWLGGGII